MELVWWLSSGVLIGWVSIGFLASRGAGPFGNIVVSIIGATLAGIIFDRIVPGDNSLIAHGLVGLGGAAMALFLVSLIRLPHEPEAAL